jgi:hypothetical protein
MSGVNDAHNHGVNLENCEYHDHGSGGMWKGNLGGRAGAKGDLRVVRWNLRIREGWGRVGKIIFN